MIDKIRPDEFAFLIERNLKQACETEDTETKKRYILRAMQLMEFDTRRREKDAQEDKSNAK